MKSTVKKPPPPPYRSTPPQSAKNVRLFDSSPRAEQPLLPIIPNYFQQRHTILRGCIDSLNSWQRNAFEDMEAEGMELPLVCTLKTKELNAKLSCLIEGILDDKALPCDMPIIVHGLSSSDFDYNVQQDFHPANDRDNYIAIELINDEPPNDDMDDVLDKLQQAYNKNTRFNMNLCFKNSSVEDSVESLSLLVLSESPARAFETFGSVASCAGSLSQLSECHFVSNVSANEDIPELQIPDLSIKKIVQLDIPITLDGWRLVSPFRMMVDQTLYS